MPSSGNGYGISLREKTVLAPHNIAGSCRPLCSAVGSCRGLYPSAIHILGKGTYRDTGLGTQMPKHSMRRGKKQCFSSLLHLVQLLTAVSYTSHTQGAQNLGRGGESSCHKSQGSPASDTRHHSHPPSLILSLWAKHVQQKKTKRCPPQSNPFPLERQQAVNV